MNNSSFIDIAGNKRSVTANFIKNQIKGKDKNVLEFYQENFADRLARLAEDKVKEEVLEFAPKFPEGFRPYNNVWRYEPAD